MVTLLVLSGIAFGVPVRRASLFPTGGTRRASSCDAGIASAHKKAKYAAAEHRASPAQKSGRSQSPIWPDLPRASRHGHGHGQPDSELDPAQQQYGLARKPHAYVRPREPECGILPAMVQRAKRLDVFSCFGNALVLCGMVCSTACAPSAPASSAAAAPSPPPSAVPASVGESQTSQGVSVFVVHSIGDVDDFKQHFEEGAAARARAGIKGHLLTRLDDGRVVVHLFADDIVKVQEVLRSPEMTRYLGREGAPESSLLWLTENQFVKVPSTAPNGTTFSLFLKLRVSDFAALKKAFQEDLPLFAEHAVIGEGLHQTFSRDTAILHFTGTSREKLDALVKRPEFGQLLAQAGSQDEVRLFGVDVSRSRSDAALSSN